MIDRRHLRWPLKVEARPATDAGSTELERLIAELSANHPTFLAIHEADSASVLVGADHELQLQENVILLQGKLPGGLQFGPPQVGYRETISQAAEVSFTGMKSPVEGKRFASIKLAISPLDARFNFQFENKVAESAVPNDLIPAVERGIQSLLDGGVCWGFPMIGLRVSLLDADHDIGALTELTLESVSRAAFHRAFLKAEPLLLEPVSKVVVVTPDDTMGALMADLTSRRSQILDTVSHNGSATLDAFVPTANLFGYSNTLASMTQGRASFVAAFSHYQRVPDTKGDGPPWPEPASAALLP